MYIAHRLTIQVMNMITEMATRTLPACIHTYMHAYIHTYKSAIPSARRPAKNGRRFSERRRYEEHGHGPLRNHLAVRKQQDPRQVSRQKKPKAFRNDRPIGRVLLGEVGAPSAQRKNSGAPSEPGALGRRRKSRLAKAKKSCTYIQSDVHTYIHTYIRTYVRIYVHIDIDMYEREVFTSRRAASVSGPTLGALRSHRQQSMRQPWIGSRGSSLYPTFRACMYVCMYIYFFNYAYM